MNKSLRDRHTSACEYPDYVPRLEMVLKYVSKFMFKFHPKLIILQLSDISLDFFEKEFHTCCDTVERNTSGFKLN